MIRCHRILSFQRIAVQLNFESSRACSGVVVGAVFLVGGALGCYFGVKVLQEVKNAAKADRQYMARRALEGVVIASFGAAIASFGIGLASDPQGARVAHVALKVLCVKDRLIAGSI